MKFKALMTSLFLLNLSCATTDIDGYVMERIELMPRADSCEVLNPLYIGLGIYHKGVDEELFPRSVDSCLISRLTGIKHKYNMVPWNCNTDTLSEMEFYFSLDPTEMIYDKNGQIPNMIFYTPDRREDVELEWIADRNNKVYRFFELK